MANKGLVCLERIVMHLVVDEPEPEIVQTCKWHSTSGCEALTDGKAVYLCSSMPRLRQQNVSARQR